MYYGYFDPINTVFHVLFWVLLVWLIVWIIRGARRRRYEMMHSMWCTGANCSHPSHGGAMSLLKERYAKGEISTEEFEEKKKVLSQ